MNGRKAEILEKLVTLKEVDVLMYEYLRKKLEDIENDDFLSSDDIALKIFEREMDNLIANSN